MVIFFAENFMYSSYSMVYKLNFIIFCRIQNFVAHAEGFRRILSLSALAPRLPEAPVAEGILLRDCQLWKSARTAWHRLLIAGMLMDYDTKKSLATVFTKNYGNFHYNCRFK